MKRKFLIKVANCLELFIQGKKRKATGWKIAFIVILAR